MIKDMDKTFDFEQVGKKIPYNVPDGFFDKLEENVMSEIKADNIKSAQPKPKAQKARTVKMTFRILLAAAAAVALFFVVTKNMPNGTTIEDSFTNVELAYNNLSTEDQEFLMEVYEEDEFINDNNEEDYDEEI
jgi:hypothetical protein